MHSVHQVGKRGTLIRFDDIPGCFTNVYVINTANRSYVIDTCLGQESVEVIKKYVQNPQHTCVINTHYHWDHIWGNCFIASPLFIGHTLCPGQIVKHWDHMYEKFQDLATGPIGKAVPNLCFDSKLEFADDDISLFYSPGHTIDSIGLYDAQDRVLFAADNIGDDMDHLVPSIYTDNETYRKTLQTYKGIDFRYCLSGHNEIAGPDIIDKILAAIEI